MATLCDSYSESNSNGGRYIGSAMAAQGLGHSFTGDGGTLDTVKFYCKKIGSPTGNAIAKIYTHSGTFGTSSVPTGTALAISGNFDVSTATTSYQLLTFTFTGGNKITLTNTTKFIVSFEYSGGDASNYMVVGVDYSEAHAGNASWFESGTWSASASTDICFYVYRDSISSPSLSPSSSPSTAISESLSPSLSSSLSPSASLSPSSSPSISPSISISLSPSPSHLPEAFFGLKIVKSGVSALTNSDIDKYIFHSDYQTLKYKLEGVISVEGTANPGNTIRVSTSITHGLNYFPFHVAYVSLDQTTYYPQSYVELGSGASIYITTWVTTTTLVLELTIDNTSGGSSLTQTAYCQYKIYINDLSL